VTAVPPAVGTPSSAPVGTAHSAGESDPQLQRRLQQDTIVLAGRTVYLNPFLYWRRFDANTDRWLREPGQLSEEQIQANRQRFYPELAWDLLVDEDELAVRREGWTAPSPKYTRGVLSKYVKLVGSARYGAVCD